jgi:hypothetical protein
VRFSIILFAIIWVGATTTAEANCFGGGSIYNCYDNNGNSYTVNKFGNSTTVNGYNSNTGSAWSQTSQRIGNSIYTNGQTNGNSWNETQTMYGGGMRSVYGTNSQGEPYNYMCNPYSGCQ